MISVIIPVYNAAPYLEACLQSVRQQTYSDLEIICVNDGSTDNSLEILRAIALYEPRMRLIDQKNAGVSVARNVGIDIATGEFVTFVDSDDEITPEMYQTLMSHQAHYDADVVHCGYRKINLDGTQKDVGGTYDIRVQDSAEAITCLLQGRYFAGGPCNKIYRRSLLNGTRFDPSLKINEDVLFNAEVFSKAGRLVHYDAPLYFYYERAGSSCSTTQILKKSQDRANAATKMLELFLGTIHQNPAAARAYHAQVNIYRTYLLSDFSGSREIRRTICRKIENVASCCTQVPSREFANYRLMKTMPALYVFIYRIYDRIRKPNWDLSRR